MNTDRDVGHIAANSLAGGRLNTDLRDTAVAISVFTKDFLDDVGVRTVNDALEYALNTATEYDATGKIEFRAQLNIDNLFNFQDPQPVRRGEPPPGTSNVPLTNGVAYAVSLPVPRRYAVTFTFWF